VGGVAWEDCEVYSLGFLRGRGPAINKTHGVPFSSSLVSDLTMVGI
jgi:hypothetical protein